MREKQKLVGRDTCTPAYDSQVRKSVTLSLNREEALSEQSLKTPSNNPHVDLRDNAAWTGVERLYPSFLLIFFPKKREKKKMDINTKEVKLVKYGRELRFTAQFPLTLTHGISLEGVR
ncbi:MAG: hypothetical protein ACYDCP_11765 [Thermoplasmataceae archaeon]